MSDHALIPDWLSQEEIQKLRDKIYAGDIPMIMRPSAQQRFRRRSWDLRVPYLRLLAMYPGTRHRDAAAILGVSYDSAAQLSWRLRKEGLIDNQRYLTEAGRAWIASRTGKREKQFSKGFDNPLHTYSYPKSEISNLRPPPTPPQAGGMARTGDPVIDATIERFHRLGLAASPPPPPVKTGDPVIDATIERYHTMRFGRRPEGEEPLPVTVTVTREPNGRVVEEHRQGLRLVERVVRERTGLLRVYRPGYTPWYPYRGARRRWKRPCNPFPKRERKQKPHAETPPRPRPHAPSKQSPPSAKRCRKRGYRWRRRQGVNPRATGDNPRALGLNPRARQRGGGESMRVPAPRASELPRSRAELERFARSRARRNEVTAALISIRDDFLVEVREAGGDPEGVSALELDEMLAAEIRERSQAYRWMMDRGLLTPRALAKWWRDIPHADELQGLASRRRQPSLAEELAARAMMEPDVEATGEEVTSELVSGGGRADESNAGDGRRLPVAIPARAATPSRGLGEGDEPAPPAQRWDDGLADERSGS
jgi:hypothetical protein